MPIHSTHLLVDGDPLTYRFGIADDPEEGIQNLWTYIHQVEQRVNADKTTIFLTAQDCNKGWRFHIARIKPYQGNRSSKPSGLPTRKLLWEHLKQSGGVTDDHAEADDLIVAMADRDPQHHVILSPDKDLRQSLAKVFGHEEEPMPFPKYQACWQILSGDRADNIPPLLKGYGPKKAEQFLEGIKTLGEAQEAIKEAAGTDTLRLAEISALVLLGATSPIQRLKDFWGRQEWLREPCRVLAERCRE